MLADASNPQRNPVYAAMVESLDDGVGRVLAALEECGLADRTVIVFFSDNGGSGKVEWIPPAGSQAGAKSVPLALSAGQWQEVTVNLAAEGPLGILRVYLPAQRQTVDVDWIELRAASRLERWEF